MLKIITILFCLSVVSFAQNSTTQAVNNEQQTVAYLDSIKSQNQLTALTAFFKLMPKGGDLHHHYSGAIFAEDLLEVAANKGLYLDTSTLTLVETPVNTVPVSSVKSNALLLGSVLSKWSIMNYKLFDNPPIPSYDHFFGTFSFLSPALYPMSQHLYTLKQRAIQENVQYIETMLLSADELPTTMAIDEQQYTKVIKQYSNSRDTVKLYKVFENIYNLLTQSSAKQRQTIKQYLSKEKIFFKALADTVNDKKFNMHFQLYMYRVSNQHFNVFSKLIANFLIANTAESVVGVNIVGAEHQTYALKNYWLHMQMFKFLKSKLPKVKTAMHAGELRSGLVPPQELNHHITQAIKIAGANRIGHGIDIAHEITASPIIQQMAANKIPVEINLTSNEFILQVSGNQHPITYYVQKKVPIVISTDDAGILRTDLTEQYVLLASRYNFGYKKIKSFVFNSIQYAFMSDREKAQHLDLLKAKFKQFEHQVSERIGF